MKRLKLLCLFLLLAGWSATAQINFFSGSLSDAMQKAQQEKKPLFVDFYAEWCGPCKLMAKEVFTLPEVGEYFNSRFICVQVDVEKDKEAAKKYAVEALPTLVFMDASGKELQRLRGAKDGRSLLRGAKVALGEELSFEKLYEKSKKEKKNFEVARQVLIEAPEFIMTQDGYNREKWGVRIEAAFKDYLKNRKLENMMNEEDFFILTQYHPVAGKDDPVFDFVVEHYSDFAAVVDKDIVANYVISLNNSYIIRQCREGNLEYKKRLERLSGDLAPVYGEFKFGDLSVMEAVTLLADGTYNLYRHNEKEFFSCMDRYFTGMGDSLSVNDITRPMEDLYTVYQGQLTPDMQRKCIVWAGMALKKEMEPSLRTRLLVIMGECLAGTGDATKAKQCYNQAFVISAQIDNEMQKKQIQGVIQQHIQGL